MSRQATGRSRLRRLAAALTLVVGSGVASIASAPAASGDSSVAISAGFSHTCALTAAGGVKCWGSNRDGELGNGSTTDSLTPVGVSGLSSGVVAVSTGVHLSCALTTSAGVKCWGANGSGQLGTGTTASSSVPLSVTGLSSGVTSVSAGYGHVCALMVDRTVRCWGSNARGSLGNGTTVNSSTPMTVPGIADVAAISSGGVHTCAITAVGEVKCWGYNAYGQIGNGTTVDALLPEDVEGLSAGVTTIASGGYHSCALTSGGSATCWGKNGNGELGNGATMDSAVPVAVSGLSHDVAALAAGAYHSCAVTSSGAARCWGANSVGELGNGGTSESSVPLEVAQHGSGVASISAGRAHTCSLSSAGRARCWGWNLNGQVGNGSTSVSVPLPVYVSWFAASFTASCSGLVCDFTDMSTDPDGQIATRNWQFGDSGTASGGTVSHTYAASGTYTVTLTVTDGAGGMSKASRTVSVTPWSLKASGAKVKSINTTSLTWNARATSSSSIDVYRNGVRVATTPNNGAFSESLGKGAATYTYAVCPAGASRCSNTATVKF